RAGKAGTPASCCSGRFWLAVRAPGLILMVPCPACDGRVVLAEFPCVATGIEPGVDHPLSKLSGMIAQPVDAVDDIHDKVKPVEVVEHHHVERCCRGAAFLESPHVEVGMVVPAISQPMDRRRVPVVGEYDRSGRPKKRVEFLVGQTLWMLRVRLESHDVHDV